MGLAARPDAATGVWDTRHRALLGLLCLHAVALPLFGATQGYGPLHAVEHGAVLAVLPALRTVSGAGAVSARSLSLSHPVRLEEFIERVHPRDREVVAATVQASCASGEPFSFEHKIVRPDGTVRVLSARGDVILGDDGQLLRVFGTGQDVTEQRDAEELQRQLAAIVQSSEDAIIAWTLEGAIVSWNHGAQMIYGYSPEEVLGEPIEMLAWGDRRDRGAAGPSLTQTCQPRHLSRSGLCGHMSRHTCTHL